MRDSRFILCSLLIAVMAAAFVMAAEATTEPAMRVLTPPVHLSAERDHQRMMNLLHLTSMPPGANGDHPNYDESKANPYPQLPDPLTLKDGRKVTTPDMWWELRRPEIVEDFDREVYGFTPRDIPAVKWEVVKETNDGKVITKQLAGHVANSAYPLISVTIALTLSTPADAKGPVPVIMQLIDPNIFARFARGFRPSTRPGRLGGAATRRSPFYFPGPTWQQQVLAQGWGYAVLDTSSVQADNGAGLTQGIIGLCNHGQPRGLEDWGVLKAWAWGASKAMDYFETDPAVDAMRVGVEGHSRWGKAALVTMAYDQRFAIAYVSSSGEGGAKLNRRFWGELVENLTGSGEYHWMAGNFMKYAGHWNDLPVDSHELIALCAPRPVLITGGTALKGDGWVDAKGMFMAAAAAGPVYRLLGKKDLGTTEMPKLGTPLIDGDLAFCQHDGGHSDMFNWPTFIVFADRYFKTPSG